MDFCSSGKALDSSHLYSTINFAYLALFGPDVDSLFIILAENAFFSTNVVVLSHLRALGLLLADSALTVGRGKTEKFLECVE